MGTGLKRGACLDSVPKTTTENERERGLTDAWSYVVCVERTIVAIFGYRVGQYQLLYVGVALANLVEDASNTLYMATDTPENALKA
jgi:hypothetical protein